MLIFTHKIIIMYTSSLNYIKEMWAHTGFQKYFKSTGWLFGSKVLCMVISFITTAFVARALGPGNFGQLSYAISFVGIFSILAGLGIDNILYRDLIKYPDKKREFLGSALIIKLIAGTFAVLVITIFTFFIAENDVSKVLIFILSITFIFNGFQIINFEFQARINSKYPAIISFIVTLILNILKIIVIVCGKGVIYLAAILLLESILYAIFYWFAYEQKFVDKIFNWKFDKNITITLLKDSWPIIFSSAFALILNRIDQIFIKNMVDAHAVGIYDSAIRVAEAWYFIPNIIMIALFPAVVNAKITSNKLYNERLKKMALFLFILATIIAIATSILAPFIIKILYGPAFIEGIKILQIYSWSLIGTFLGMLVMNYLITENFRKISFLINIIPMLTNIILNIIWIPKYGIVGSAYATLVSYSLGPISIILFKQTRLKFKEILLISKKTNE